VFLLSSLDYFAFDRQSLRLLQGLQKQGSAWDLVHCPTPVSPLAVPTLDRLGLPLVLGPWNGGLQSPATFPEFMQQDSAWLYPVRNLGKILAKMNGGLERASVVFTATEATERSIAPRYRSRCVRMLENGVDLSLFRPSPWPQAPSAAHPLRILFVGRLIPAKGVPMLIEAVQELSRYFPLQLTVIGDGPEAENLTRYASYCGLSGCVDFLGAQPLEKVSAAMQEAHVFCLPSVRESGGSVLLEAMAAARPVIAVAYGGPREIVDEEVGLAIEPVDRNYVVRHLVLALDDVVSRPEVWKQKGERGRQRAEQNFAWDAKIRQALRHYQRLVEGEFGAVQPEERTISNQERQPA
jgi:glycosyltransferase involved in cell wall biosynthesis